MVNNRLVNYIKNTKNPFYKGMYLSRENLGLKPFFTSISDCFNAPKTGYQSGVWGQIKNYDIVTFFNLYNNSLKNIIDSSDLEF